MHDPWEEVSHPREAKEHFVQYLKNEVSHLNFYRLHMLYFLVTILISSVIVYGEGLANGAKQVDGKELRYVDALFLCCSAMTTTGLNSVNLGDLTAFQQAVLAVLLLIGNVIFISTFVVIVRRHFFRRKLADIVQHSRSGRKVVEDLEQQEVGHGHHGSGLRKRATPNGQHMTVEKKCGRKVPLEETEKPIRRRHYHHSAGYGAFPWPWETHTFQHLIRRPFHKLHKEWQVQERSYISFEPDLDERGRFRNLKEHEREELGGVEYRALETLFWILIAFQLFWLALGTAFLVPYSYRSDIKTIITSSQPGDLNPGWFGFFAVVTSFANGGLNVLNVNYVPFQRHYLLLIVSGALTVVGNTQFPILLRLIIYALSKASPKASCLRQTALFLLHYPRRCFIYLFPSKETWYLLAIQVAIDTTMWVLFELLNLGLPAVMALPPGTRAVDGLFQATGLRTSGAYIISISSLAPALLVAYLVTMYISSFPVVMALRQTNTYEERSIGLDRDSVHSAGSADSSSGSGGGGSGSGAQLGPHIRRQLAYDIWFQLLAWGVICTIERAKLDSNAPGFSIFSILFEIVSAYGTVGLSTGVPSDSYSLSGAFDTGSKLVMAAVMLRGRHRGLPLAIDRSILLPGEDLMHRLDREYGEHGGWVNEEEREEREKLTEREIRKREMDGGREDERGEDGVPHVELLS
ncbi:uncharacterized protein K452DRAFT_166316 [Aplosporella prunicola CBS 121167]|uniref:Potassium transport protein n=1 Tax=Aplosporella prunicola CBS 121167 TaxID=1176127 RepID=A0A6A6AWY0_9PEZI|nr:uncharacterized protein K452DRAFT_166316 [Aplosporella prunicola CBS 121167]KAF2135683.1 hypothetical protein K452DRAFT_166316 [Aplosporella prunicola CBS 121167]